MRRALLLVTLSLFAATALSLEPARAQASSKGYLEMPEPEDGSYRLTAKTGSGRNWGTPTFVRYLVMVAREWKRRHPEGPILRIGDMSKPDGSNFPPHKTHKDGLTADLFTWPQNACHVNFKDQALTEELAQLMVDLGAKQILYNGARVIKAIPIVKKWPKHDDHFHIVIDPARVPRDGTVLVLPEVGRRTGDWIAAKDLDAEGKQLELAWRVVGEPKLKGTKVEFGSADDPKAPLLHASELKKIRGSSYRLPVALEHGKRYRWRVILVTAESESASAWQTLTTDLRPPQVSALAPKGDAKLDARPLLQWSYSKAEAAQVRYWVELDKDRNHRKISGKLGPFAGSKTTHALDPPPPLRRNKKYFWRVVVEDAHGNEAATEWLSFKTSSAYGKGKPEAAPKGGGKAGRKGTVVNAISLNLRAGPGTNHAVRGALPKGTVVKILSESKGWFEVEANVGGQVLRGFVSASYVKE